MTHDEKQAGVLPQRADASGKADDEDESAGENEDERGVEGELAELAEVLEHVLLRPRPQPDAEHHATQQLKWTTPNEL